MNLVQEPSLFLLPRPPTTNYSGWRAAPMAAYYQPFDGLHWHFGAISLLAAGFQSAYPGHIAAVIARSCV